jgi:trehalose synthase
MEGRRMEEVDLYSLSPDRFREVLDPSRAARFEATLANAAAALGGRSIWNVNSTAHGGGVAEMLTSLLGYLLGAGLGVRWLVVGGDADFFRVTKRIHNRLHGQPGDGGSLGEEERAIYERVLEPSARALAGLVDPGDVVVLHDPQTAGLTRALRAAGASVVWVCHVGSDTPNELARSAWTFLRTHLDGADAFVFSRALYAWEGLPADRMTVIPPCIDAFSAKNQALGPPAVQSILDAAGILDATPTVAPTYRRSDGSAGTVARRADVLESERIPPEAPLVVQVSRWDRLKDPLGVLEGFARHVPPSLGAHLVLAGPAAGRVTDDPEDVTVLGEVRQAWESLAPDGRRRVHVACLSMDDPEENAAIVNALQRRADVIVQKSLAEGFGLTVAEAMWKRRPVIGARVGGIQDQIVDEESGLLVGARDAASFGAAVTRLLEDPALAARLGHQATQRVLDHYLVPSYLTRQLALIIGLTRAQRAMTSPAGQPAGDPD